MIKLAPITDHHRTAYAATGAQPIASTTTGTVPVRLTISRPGLTTVRFYATDKAGNAESPQHSETVFIASSAFACAAPTPSGFTMPTSGSVTIKGTITVRGRTRPFTITLRFGSHGVTFATPVTITSRTLPAATVGTPYHAQLHAAGDDGTPMCGH